MKERWASRFEFGDDLSPEGLGARLGVGMGTAHRAADDAEATLALLAKLQALVERDSAARRAAVQ